MNTQNDLPITKGSRPKDRRPAKRPARGRVVRPSPLPRSATTSAQPLASSGLGRASVLLLKALAEAGAYAMVDPTDSKAVIVRQLRAGMSVGGGSHALAIAEELVEHDLARWLCPSPGRRILEATVAGRSHLRRLAAREGDPFLGQHRETAAAEVETTGGRTRVRLDLEESPLDWLRRRKGRDGMPLIDVASYEAGERLRRDITCAGLLPSITSRWDCSPGAQKGSGGPTEITDRVVAARQRVRLALEAVGADLGDLLIDICGFLKGLELIERERRWPARSAKVIVKLALSRLAEHYGLGSEARGPSRASRIRSWQDGIREGGRMS